MTLEIWEIIPDQLVTPDDLRTGRVEAGPLHGADTVAGNVYTLSCKSLGNGCSRCALRLDFDTLKKVIASKVFIVQADGYWNTFASSKVKLYLANGEPFNVIPSIFDKERIIKP